MILIVLNMVLRRKSKKKCRKVCVHRIFAFIINNGAFFTLYDEPGKDERSSLNYF